MPDLKDIAPSILIGALAALLVLWTVMVVWTYADIRARSEDSLSRLLATLLVLVFSFPGLLVYLALRPRRTLLESYERWLDPNGGT